jgi:hypothetical protein
MFVITSRVKLELLQMFENDSVKSNPKFRQEAVHVLAIQTVSDLLGHSIHELHHIERRLKNIFFLIFEDYTTLDVT